MSGRKIYIWGGGKIGKDFVKNAKFRKEWILVDGYISSMLAEETDVKNYKDVIFEKDCIVIIATIYTDEILKTIIRNTDLHLSQCVALRTTEFSSGFGVDARRLTEIVENYWEFIPVSDRMIKTPRTYYDYRRECLYDDETLQGHKHGYKDDYVRINTFDMVADEIKKKNLQGAVAELGVFKGDFSEYINKKFSDCKLYLFDTFKGFDKKEAEEEILKNHANKSFVEGFLDTSLELVMNKMTVPEKCVIKKGLFPDTAVGLEEKFIFVSIDVDFENSTYEGLKYFYPRLVDGGYIFVHDYNHLYLDGVKKAVERYEKDFQKIAKVPISDTSGTLVITK